MSAVLSPCGTYRYALLRPLQRRLEPLVDEEGATVLFVMLNPSTPDDVEDDPTIRRCLRFARREGFARLAVANLYALRATDPGQLAVHPDPVGPENDFWIRDLASAAETIVCAWGAKWAHAERVDHVRELLTATGRPLCCLGLTSAGCPRHPLYLPSTQPLVRFDYEVAA